MKLGLFPGSECLIIGSAIDISVIMIFAKGFQFYFNETKSVFLPVGPMVQKYFSNRGEFRVHWCCIMSVPFALAIFI